MLDAIRHRFEGISKLIMATFFTFACISAFAHTDLKSSDPADGAVMNHSPEQLHLTFTEAVSLVRFNVTDAEGKMLKLDFTPSTEAKTEYLLAIPHLADGHYKTEWAVIGEDGHTVTGTFGFLIDPAATPSHGHESSGGHAH